MIFVDAIVEKVRDGGRSPTGLSTSLWRYRCRGAGHPGIWAGNGGAGATFWLGVLTEVKNRGVTDVCIIVCEGRQACRSRSHHVGARGRADLSFI